MLEILKDRPSWHHDCRNLELCNGIDENAVGACSELIFTPIDEMFPNDAPLIPSGFCIIPLDPKSVEFGDTKNALVTMHRTLDLTSSLDVTPMANQGSTDMSTCQTTRSVLTITFQFPFENSLAESVATMARQYVRSLINSVQRVVMAISPSSLSPCVGPKTSPGSPEALTLAQWICQSYM
ncbi:putative class III homeodomain-leucine zipper family [Helianthus annuus]|nr:putative class III homeodomain-leucine zipper family [Helianthus annuus]